MKLKPIGADVITNVVLRELIEREKTTPVKVIDTYMLVQSAHSCYIHIRMRDKEPSDYWDIMTQAVEQTLAKYHLGWIINNQEVLETYCLEFLDKLGVKSTTHEIYDHGKKVVSKSYYLPTGINVEPQDSALLKCLLEVE